MIQDTNKGFLIGALAIIIAAMAWSLDGTIIRPNFYEFPALNIVLLEHLFGALLLSPFIIWGWSRIKKMNSKALMGVLWVSFFGGLIGTLMITQAYFAAFAWETTLSTVIILQKLQPVFAIGLAGLILREKLSKTFYCWAVIAILSWYMIAFESLWKDILNIHLLSNPSFYAILAAFAFWSSTVFGKRLVWELGFKLTTALRFTCTALMAWIAMFIFWDILSIWELWAIHWILLWIIVISSGAVALFLYYYWLKKVTASSATIFELAYPLSWIFFDWYFNGNILSISQIIFSLILIISFFMIIKEGRWK